MASCVKSPKCVSVCDVFYLVIAHFIYICTNYEYVGMLSYVYVYVIYRF